MLSGGSSRRNLKLAPPLFVGQIVRKSRMSGLPMVPKRVRVHFQPSALYGIGSFKPLRVFTSERSESLGYDWTGTKVQRKPGICSWRFRQAVRPVRWSLGGNKSKTKIHNDLFPSTYRQEVCYQWYRVRKTCWVIFVWYTENIARTTQENSCYSWSMIFETFSTNR